MFTRTRYNNILSSYFKNIPKNEYHGGRINFYISTYTRRWALLDLNSPKRFMITNVLNKNKGIFNHCLSFNERQSFTTSKDNSQDKEDYKISEETRSKLNEIVNSHKVVIFIKGSPEEPMCGFSFNVIKILSKLGLDEYAYIDVMKSDMLRNAIKQYSSWPTIPQVYINGEFLGGSDILDEMFNDGSLKEYLEDLKILKT